MASKRNWVIYYKSTCDPCHRTLDKLMELDDPIEVRNCDAGEHREWLLNNNFKSVPQVFLNGDLVGGSEATEAFLKEL